MISSALNWRMFFPKPCNSWYMHHLWLYQCYVKQPSSAISNCIPGDRKLQIRDNAFLSEWHGFVNPHEYAWAWIWVHKAVPVDLPVWTLSAGDMSLPTLCLPPTLFFNRNMSEGVYSHSLPPTPSLCLPLIAWIMSGRVHTIILVILYKYIRYIILY